MDTTFFKQLFNFKKKDGTTNKKKGCLFAVVVIVIFEIVGWAIIEKDEKEEAEGKNEIAEYIEKEDFNAARKAYRKQYLYGNKDVLETITRAQVASLIDQGYLDLASQIAVEDENYDIYYQTLMSKIVPLYNSNKSDLFLALSTIQFEKVKDGHYNKTTEIKNDIIKGYNTNVAQLMLYAKTNGNLDDVKQLADFLRPQHKEQKINDNEVEYLGQIDYSDVNRIRKEFGLKPK